MPRPLYSVFYDYGPGGMTTAVLDRTRLLSEHGIDCKILTFAYNPDGSRFLKDNVSRGRVHPSVQTVNIFDHHERESRVGALRRRRSSELLRRREKGLLQEDARLTANYIRYFTKDGTYVKFDRFEKNDGRLLHTDFFDERRQRIRRCEYRQDGTLHRTTYFSNGSKAYEKYHNIHEKCFLIRWFDPITGKGTSVYRIDEQGGRAVRFDSLWHWRRAWITALAESEPSAPTIVADGTDVPGNLLAIPREVARRCVFIHTNHIDRQGATAKRYWYFDRLNEFDAVLTWTPGQAQDIAENYQIEDGKVWPILPAVRVSTEVFSPSPPRTSIVTRITPGKRLEESLRIFKMVTNSVPSARLDIYGEPVSGSGRAHQQELMSLVDRLGLQQNVAFHGYSDSPLEELRDSTVSLVTSESESACLAILESLSVGTPVVAYDCKYGPSDFIRDGENGFLLEWGDQRGAARAIASLLTAPGRATEMGQEAIALLRSEFSIEAQVSSWTSVFSAL